MAAWAAVKAALVSALPAVVGSSVTVYDGPVVTGEAPRAYLTIGNQPSSEQGSSGVFSQANGPDGFAWLETGTVLCELGALSADPTLPSVFASFDAITAYLAGNQLLAGSMFASATVSASAEVVQLQTTAGATQHLLISINYQTRLP